MFNVGPMELMVLAIVGLVVLGPDKLPGLARDAAQLLRTLRDLATGARQQLRDELGPEFADVDLRNLNPRTAVARAVFGDEVDFTKLNPRNAVRDAVLGDGDLQAADPRKAFRETRDEMYGRNSGSSARAAHTADQPVQFTKPVSRQVTARGPARPRPRPAPRSSFDDVT
ncbi:MAG: Sec-independent protein translocase protein TatB [Actinomycetota bacterium]|nr:Sec-independent protein translocase protein TatB [Actinomycetota bacterium]